jgi:biopolymer transport protein ExbD
MADTGPSALPSRSDAAGDDSPLGARKPLSMDSRFDVTAMVDLIFLMNIFFMVDSITKGMSEVDLPPAKHAIAVDADTAVIMTLCATETNQTAGLYLGDGRVDQPLTTAKAQEDGVRPFVEAGLKEGKSTVVIKAERKVLYRDVERIATAASVVPGTQLNLAVWEKD